LAGITPSPMRKLTGMVSETTPFLRNGGKVLERVANPGKKNR